MRLFVILLGFVMIMSSQAQAFDLYEWVLQWHFELGWGNTSAPVTQPANPWEYEYCTQLGDCRTEVLHSEFDEHGTSDSGGAIAGQVPITQVGKTTLGMHLGYQWLDGLGHGTRASVGAYASHPLVGPLDAIAWVGHTTYRVRRGHPQMLWWTGTASTLSYGTGVQATFKHLTLKASYEATGAATIKNLTYMVGQHEIYPPAELSPLRWCK